MRISRSTQLPFESGLVHKYWRCHNREYLLKSHEIKDLYLNSTEYALTHKSVNSNVKLYSYCLMDNHTHMQMSYSNNSSYISNFMRISHARFGAAANKIFRRTGKVANERPKTPLIENEEHSMRVHFYIEANPVRAQMVKAENLRFYKYSSYKFYAHGIRDGWSKLLTIPDWYIKLGKTRRERQSKYRRLFLEYLENELFGFKWIFEKYIGRPSWKLKMAVLSKEIAESPVVGTISSNSS